MTKIKNINKKNLFNYQIKKTAMQKNQQKRFILRILILKKDKKLKNHFQTIKLRRMNKCILNLDPYSSLKEKYFLQGLEKAKLRQLNLL